MKYKNWHLKIWAIGVIAAMVSLTGCSKVNTEGNENFDEDGYATYTELDSVSFTPTDPARVKFYFEVSGSMNGFFRSNKPTGFKRDVYDVLTRCSEVLDIYVMKDLKGENPLAMTLAGFQQAMNAGAFETKGSTLVPSMLTNILGNLNADNGEVAVFVSDMRYDPIGQQSPKVLVTQYFSEVCQIFHYFGKSVSLVCATSEFLDKSGNAITDRAPYYFLIMGKDQQVARVRNLISAALKNNGRFVDNFDAGFNYGRPKYSFGVPSRCYQMDDNEPTFVGYEDEEIGDTCTIKLKVPLENYRWVLQDEDYFDTAFNVKSVYGSMVSKSDIVIDKKKMEATVSIKVFGMPLDSEVLEWSIKLPDADYTQMSEFFDGASDPNDPTMSFSVKSFCEGVYATLKNKIEPNYILISKKN